MNRSKIKIIIFDWLQFYCWTKNEYFWKKYDKNVLKNPKKKKNYILIEWFL